MPTPVTTNHTGTASHVYTLPPTPGSRACERNCYGRRYANSVHRDRAVIKPRRKAGEKPYPALPVFGI